MEDRAGRDPGMLDVFLDGLAGDGIETDHAALVALFMNADRGVAVLQVEVLHFQAAAGAEANTGIDEQLQDGAVAVFQDRLARRQAHELPGADDGERPGLIAGISRFTGDELRVRGIGHCNEQAQLGRSAVKILVEAGKRADAPIEGFGRRAVILHPIAEGLDIHDRNLKQPNGVLGPADASEMHERHDVFAVRALRMLRLPARDPGLENGGD